MKRNNRGYSLVELIAVIAILAVVAAGSFVSINLISGRPAIKAANLLTQTLRSARLTASGKLENTVTIYRDSAGNLYAEVSFTDGNGNALTNQTKLGDKRVKMSYKVSGETAERELNTSADDPLVLQFDRATGAFRPTVGGKYCTEIRTSKANKTGTVILHYLTGKIVVK